MAPPITGYSIDYTGNTEDLWRQRFSTGVIGLDVLGTGANIVARSVGGYDIFSLPFSSLYPFPNRNFTAEETKFWFQGEATAAYMRSGSHVILDLYTQRGVVSNESIGTTLDLAGQGISLGTIYYFGHVVSGTTHPWADTIASRSLAVYDGNDPYINGATLAHNIFANHYAGASFYSNFGRMYWFDDAQAKYKTYDDYKVDAFIAENGLPDGVTEEQIAQAFATISEGDSSNDVDLRVLMRYYGYTEVTAFEALFTASSIQTTANSNYQSANQFEAILRTINYWEMASDLNLMASSSYGGNKAIMNLNGDSDITPANWAYTFAEPVGTLGSNLARSAVGHENLNAWKVTVPTLAHLLENSYGLYVASEFYHNPYAGGAALQAGASWTRSYMRPQVQATLGRVSPEGYLPNTGLIDGIPTNTMRNGYIGFTSFLDMMSTSNGTRLAIDSDWQGSGIGPAITNYAAIPVEALTTLVVSTPKHQDAELQNYVVGDFETTNIWAGQDWTSFGFASGSRAVGVGTAFLLELWESSLEAKNTDTWSAGRKKWHNTLTWFISNDNDKPAFALLPDKASEAIAQVLKPLSVQPTFDFNSKGLLVPGVQLQYSLALGKQAEASTEPEVTPNGKWIMYEGRPLWVSYGS